MWEPLGATACLVAGQSHSKTIHDGAGTEADLRAAALLADLARVAHDTRGQVAGIYITCVDT
jgi:hypothetical protein